VQRVTAQGRAEDRVGYIPSIQPMRFR